MIEQAVVGRRPAFNVSGPFQNVITVQMNQEFRQLLLRFLSEMNDEFEDIEVEIQAFRYALLDPVTCQQIREAKQYRNRQPNVAYPARQTNHRAGQGS